ncbi:MAG: efflux RND transporter periplasmic adaptor subunit [Desulfomonilaceae bacterium]|nr:efflux RND transporter periplasmic adaptor subunit [Desulfomonilaceae bacterium]
MRTIESHSLTSPPKHRSRILDAAWETRARTRAAGAYGLRFKIVLRLAVLTAFLAGAAACGRGEGSPTKNHVEIPEAKVTVVKVEPTPIRDVLLLPGVAEALHDVTLASDREGRVEWIGPREGQRVKEGELLAKIDVAALQTALDRYKAAHELAEIVAERRKSLHEGMIVSQEEMEKAETERMLALHNVREARINFEQGFVRSPIDGVVNRLEVDPGEFVRRGQAVLEIVAVDRMRINVDVPEMDVRYLKVWQNARVTVAAFPGEHWDGLVDFVAFKADPATKTFKARVVVDNTDGRMRPGMIAHVSFLRRLVPDAVVAPLFSIVDKGGERILFVEEDGTARARTVTTGVIENHVVQIVDGLNPGDNLIVTGQHNVEDGMRVSTR